ncbi:hypothetical protein [Streptomyces cinereoruber]|uniref:hypothetical protein n=1 Tax=Streptomyces cinereoruber TaxID=67260 RepID=UPI00362C652C
MARICIWVAAQHRDGTLCSHPAADAPHAPATGCSGPVRYQVMCTEHGALGRPLSLRMLAEAAQDTHHHEHRAVLARRAEQ